MNKTFARAVAVGAVVLAVQPLGGCRRTLVVAAGPSLEIALAAGSPGVLTSADATHQSVDFEGVPLGASRAVTLELANVGVSSMTVVGFTATAADAQFTSDSFPSQMLAPGSKIEVTFRFAPTGSGLQAAAFRLATDWSAHPDIDFSLTGNGVVLSLQALPPSLDFGKVLVGSSLSKSITLLNQSAQSVDLTIAAIKGSSAPLFQMAAVPATRLAPGAELKIAVTFSPQLPSDVASVASFEVSFCEGCVLPIHLTGEGVATGVAVEPNPVAFGFVPVASTVTRAITVANVANLPVLLKGFSLASARPGAFIIGPGAPTPPALIPPGQSLTIPISFVPSFLDVFAGKVEIDTSDSNSAQVLVPLRGYGGGAALLCTPPVLDFGQQAVGIPVSLRFLCENVGAEVPNHPEADLWITSLSSDATAFQVAFDQPFPTAGLPAGQVAVIDVTFNPSTAGLAQGEIDVESNAGPLLAPVQGTGLELKPCEFQVLPTTGLAFGFVPVGVAAKQQVAIINQGVDDCLLRDLDLDPGGDPSFSLPDGPIGSSVLGGPGGQGGLPSELDVTVQFLPQQAGTVAGRVLFNISDPKAPNRVIPLSGGAQDGCVIIVPGDTDFGTVGITDTSPPAWCHSSHRNFRAVNTCAADVHLTRIDLDEVHGRQDFALTGVPSLPIDLIAGNGFAQFQVTFTPQEAGHEIAGIRLQTQESSTPSLASIEGTADARGVQTDTFTSQAPEVDLMVVLDLDDEGTPWPLYDNLGGFLAYPTLHGIEFHVAVVSTELCATGEHGNFWPCDDCHFCNVPGSSAEIIGSQDKDPSIELAELLSPLNAWNSCYNVVGYAPGDDQLFAGAVTALDPTLIAGHNAGFLGDHSALAILLVNGDDEDDNSPESVSNYYNILLSAVAFDHRRIQVYHLTDEPLGWAASRISALTSATGGSILAGFDLPAELDGIWSTAANGLPAAFGTGPYFLSELPADPAPADGMHPDGVGVSISGASMPAINAQGETQWRYDPVSNAIILSLSAVPPPGSSLTITYKVACQ